MGFLSGAQPIVDLYELKVRHPHIHMHTYIVIDPAGQHMLAHASDPSGFRLPQDRIV